MFYIYRSLIHLEFILVCGLRDGSNFIFFSKGYPVVPTPNYVNPLKLYLQIFHFVSLVEFIKKITTASVCHLYHIPHFSMQFGYIWNFYSIPLTCLFLCYKETLLYSLMSVLVPLQSCASQCFPSYSRVLIFSRELQN